MKTCKQQKQSKKKNKKWMFEILQKLLPFQYTPVRLRTVGVSSEFSNTEQNPQKPLNETETNNE